ncbi:MAG: protein kinase [Holophagales bacterium]|nr:MAG: protein kinase [Holophagales bacterium]
MSESSLPELFARAIELGAEGRSQLLALLDADDPALAARLARLLESAEGGSPLDRSPWDTMRAARGKATPLPERIGPYRVLSELGRGGMARVFLAVEETELYQRQLAVKVLERPAGDADSARRFREEVRLLSTLEHPGIARFLDGGQTEDGHLYLALEHVDGVDLLTWADSHRLATRERVELYLSALAPLRWAHARGVIHRDLKPGHFLVDAEGRPRLLDFGLSKLTDPREPAATTLTATRALTPAYASPEQFVGEAISTASDIYSLGAILYELLCGRRPFADLEERPGAFERAVLDTDPAPPSTVDPLDADLDAICLRALRKNPGDRYRDADALARDLERYLSGAAVEARRGGWRYRSARFVRRHRSGITTAAALALAALATTVALSMSRPSRPAPPPPRPFPFSAVGRLDLDTLRRDFAAAPDDPQAGALLVLRLLPEQRLDEARLVVARLRQIPGREEDALTDYAEAALASRTEQPQRAVVLLRRGLEKAIVGHRGELVGQIRAMLARNLSRLGDREAARQEMELALASFEQAGDHASAGRVLNNLGLDHQRTGDLEVARQLLDRGLHEVQQTDLYPGSLLINLALLDILRGRPDLAEPALRQVAEVRSKESNRRQYGDVLGFLGQSLFELGRTTEAAAQLDAALAILRAPGDFENLQQFLESRAELAYESGRLDEVEPIARELRSAAEGAGTPLPLALARGLEARLAAARGEIEPMRRGFADSLNVLDENGDLDNAVEIGAAHATAEWRAGSSSLARGAAEAVIRRYPEGAREVRAIYLARCLRLRTLADDGELEAASRELALLGDGDSAPAPGRRIAFLLARAALARAEGRLPAARADLDSALAIATAAGRKLDELDVRLAQATLASAVAHAPLRELAREADSLGLELWAQRARTAVAQQDPR